MTCIYVNKTNTVPVLPAVHRSRSVPDEDEEDVGETRAGLHRSGQYTLIGN